MDQLPDTNNSFVPEWTILIYFAADNNLEEVAFKNLQLMKQVGSTSRVNIIAQIDTRGVGKMVRFRLRNQNTTLEEDVLGVYDEINTGLGSELTRFMTWGMNSFKAKKYMLVIWGHGEGWQSAHDAHRAAGRTVDAVRSINEDFSLSISRKGEVKVFLKPKAMKTLGQFKKVKHPISLVGSALKQLGAEITTHKEGDEPKTVSELAGQASAIWKGLVKKSLPYTQDLMDRISLAITDPELDPEGGSSDVLTNEELKKALEDALKKLTPETLDILAMDACLMGMAETGYQVRGLAQYLIASEDTVPLNSWPYDRILTRLVDDPEMDAEELTQTIIREFLIHYRDYAKGVTLSACKLDPEKGEQLKKVLSDLADTLTKNIGQTSVLKAVLAARALAQSFYLKEFIDLYDFCEQLKTMSNLEKLKSPDAAVMETISKQCQAVMDAIYIDDRDNKQKTFVYAYGHCGYPVKNAKGVSIYFPIDRHPNAEYEKLEFIKQESRMGWGDFLTALISEIGIPPSEKKETPIKEVQSSAASSGARGIPVAEEPPVTESEEPAVEDLSVAESEDEDQQAEEILSLGQIKWPQGTQERIPISSLGFVRLPSVGGRRKILNNPFSEHEEELRRERIKNARSGEETSYRDPKQMAE